MDVWQIDLGHGGALDVFLDMLDDEEKSRAGRFRFERHFRCFVLAHAATRSILSLYTGGRAADLVFAQNAYGKPFLANGDGPVFSLSHSGAIALCSVAGAGEIGVDVEKCRDIDSLELARRFFSPIESKRLECLAPDQKEEGFFACWTRKEAYIKAKGLGLSLPLNQFSVELDPNQPVTLIASDYAPEDVGRFRLWDVPVPAGYKAALAYCGAEEGLPGWHRWVFTGPALAA